MINYLLLVSRQGKLRLQKWYITLTSKEKAKIIKDLTQLTLARRARMCNFLEYKGMFFADANECTTWNLGRKIVYRRYASLFFICAIDEGDNELAALEIIHRYVEVLDKFFGNVCELDLIFNFEKAYSVLDELLLAGELQDPSRRAILESVHAMSAFEMDDLVTRSLSDYGFM